MEDHSKAHLSEETFDEFLESEGLPAVCEEGAIKEIIADQIRARIVKSSNLDDWIWSKISNRDLVADLRNRLAGAAFTTVLYHHQATLRLVDADMLPTAFALARILFEAGITGLWIENCATDDELDRLSKAEWNPTIPSMIKRVEKTDGFAENIISRTKAINWDALNDYTHCRGRMLQRMITPDDIGNNFSSDETIEVLQFAGAWALLATLGIARLCDDIKLQNDVLERCKAEVSSDNC